MVQAEVADRIAAKSSTKAYGANMSLFAQVTGRFEVGPWQLCCLHHASTLLWSAFGRTQARNPLTLQTSFLRKISCIP